MNMLEAGSGDRKRAQARADVSLNIASLIGNTSTSPSLAIAPHFPPDEMSATNLVEVFMPG